MAFGAQAPQGYPPQQRPAAPPQRRPAPPARRPAQRPPVRPPPPKKVMGEDALMELGSARKSTHYIMRYIITLVLLAFGIYTMLFPGLFAFASFAAFYISLVVVVLGVIVLAISELSMMMTDYAITRTRVIEREGIVRKKTNAVQVTMITGTKVRQGILDRILGVGTLEINTHYKEHAITLDYINDPQKVESFILSLQSGGHMPAPQAPPQQYPPAPPQYPPQAPPAYPPARQPQRGY
jgi:membrane protein YdbS with pleckstrin-like domain